MNDLKGPRGELGITVTVKRKATGKEETYHLTSIVEGEDAEKAQRMVEEINQQTAGAMGGTGSVLSNEPRPSYSQECDESTDRELAGFENKEQPKEQDDERNP